MAPRPDGSEAASLREQAAARWNSDAQDMQRLIDDALAETPPGRCVWVALSGGLDSSLLLTLAPGRPSSPSPPAYALHVDHGLQAPPTTLATADDCASPRRAAHIERVMSIRPRPRARRAAREARYAAFARAGPGETLWLAQHRDDQAETLLLAALRGSGVRGWPACRQAATGRGHRLARPCSDLSRATLEAEAEALGSPGWRIRPTPMRAGSQLPAPPRAAAARVPLARGQASLARSASLAGEADSLLAELAALDLSACGDDPGRLALWRGTRALSAPRRRLLIRYACQRLALPTPPAGRLSALDEQLTARVMPRCRWPGQAPKRVAGVRVLYLQRPLADLPVGWQADWDGLAWDLKHR